MPRPPKPRALKLLDGNPGKRAILDEPKAPLGLPAPPRGFTAAERGAWRALSGDLERLGILQTVDRNTVELAAWHLARRRRLAAFLAEHGEVYSTVTPSGSEMQRSRPEVALLHDSDAFLARFSRRAAAHARSFDLTTSSHKPSGRKTCDGMCSA